MLARKISARSGTSCGSIGRIASCGWARMLITPPPPRHARACHGHPRLRGLAEKTDADGRDKPGHDGSGSSRDLPGGAVLGVFEHYAHFREFVADAIGFLEILRAARGDPISNARIDYRGVQASFARANFLKGFLDVSTHTARFDVVDCPIKAEQQEGPD